ncbi:MAG TPA: hypothetical protein VF683_07575, partial [Chthoniobacterales bacterium]
MSTRAFLLVVLCAFAAGTASAYPPAPYHRIYGTVRDEQGHTLGSEQGSVILYGTAALEIARGVTDPNIGPDLNYSVHVQMDSGTTALLYEVTALRPLLPFTIRVVIGGVTYVPIQAVSAFNIGDPAGQTRIDLTIGVDTDTDGLPDSWEQELIDTDTTGTLHTLTDVRPDDDLDGDGLTNAQEYIAGTYALDGGDRLELKVIQATSTFTRLRFLAITGRTYRLTSTPRMGVPFVEQPFALTPTGDDVLFY